MRRVFLIGYMGAGKTTLGKELSRRAGLSFIDLDYYIEGRYRQTVSQLFAERGEAGFREIERNLLHEVGAFEDVLVSTGGGTPCFFDNMDFMLGQGTTVYLRVPVDELAARLEIGKHSRPVLRGRSGEELRAFIAKSLAEREPFYMRASILFDAERMTTESDVRTLADALLKMI